MEQKSTPRIIRPTGCLWLALALFFCATGQAQPVFETFDYGYPGNSANGWTTAWYAAGFSTPAVSNTYPLLGGGNYLTFGNTAVNADSVLNRTYFGGLLATNLVIQLNLRVDALNGFSTTNDYISLTDGLGSVTNVGGASANSAYIIRAYGAAPGGGLPAMTWGLYNGKADGGSFYATNLISSGMGLATNNVYTFTITLHPAAQTYDVIISNATTGISTTNTGLGFRCTAASFGVPRTMVFNARMAAAADSQQFSLDTISVGYAPPSFTPQPGVGYRIEDRNSGLMLWENIYNGSAHVPLVLQTFRGGGDATWVFTAASGGYYQILNPLRNLMLTCDSGDSAVYLETNKVSSGNLWSLSNLGGGYAALINKRNGNALTVQSPPGVAYSTMITASYSGLDWQKFWIDEFQINPAQIIAVPAGYDPSAAKTIILCSSNNLGSSVTGTISYGTNSTAATFAYQASLWNQFYYSYTDAGFCQTTGVYTVSAPGFNPVSFLISPNVYFATPNGLNETVGITDILSGFFAWQRETGPQTNLTEVLMQPGGSYTIVGYGGVPGGWKDATSIDMETIQNAAALLDLSYAAEDTVNTNDRTGLLNEAAYGASFFVRFQNPDGSFPVNLVPNSTLVTGTTGIITANVDCGIDARVVMSLAAASRVLNGYSNELSAQCLNAASNGWVWVKNNQTNYINDSTIYPSYWWGNADSVVGAASELALTTGAPQYYSDLTNFFYAGEFDGNGNWVARSGSYVHQSDGRDTALGLSRYCARAATGTLQTDMATQLTNFFNAEAAVIDTPFGTDSGTFNGGFGGNEGYELKALEMLNLYCALGNPQMLADARNYMNWMYGANPFGSSFFIGIGNLNVVPQFARPRPGSIGEDIPGIVTTTNESLTTWGGSDYGVGEGGVGDTSLLPPYMALMDHLVAGVSRSDSSFTNANPALLSVVISNQMLMVTWPADHLGWILQSETNANGGLGPNWADVAGTGVTTNFTVGINPAQPAVYFRMRFP